MAESTDPGRLVGVLLPERVHTKKKKKKEEEKKRKQPADNCLFPRWILQMVESEKKRQVQTFRALLPSGGRIRLHRLGVRPWYNYIFFLEEYGRDV